MIEIIGEYMSLTVGMRRARQRRMDRIVLLPQEYGAAHSAGDCAAYSTIMYGLPLEHMGTSLEEGSQPCWFDGAC